MSPYVKDVSAGNMNNNNSVSFKQEKEIKKSKDSAHRINTAKGKDNTLEKRLSEDVDERHQQPFMKPKYKKPTNKKLNLHTKPKSNLHVNFAQDDKLHNKSNKIDNSQSNLYPNGFGPSENNDLLEEQLNWISEMAREKYGSSEQIDEILQKQRKKYRFQLRDYMKALKTVSHYIYLTKIARGTERRKGQRCKKTKFGVKNKIHASFRRKDS